MQTAKSGDQVTVLYDGMIEGGEIFDSSTEAGPLDFQVGQGNVMAGFDQAVAGMELGETKRIMIQAKNAYGLRQEELVHKVSRSSWAPEAEITAGVVVGMTMEKDGQQHKVPAMVTEVVDDMVSVDFNHPLAGKNIIFQITLKKINNNEAAPDSLGSAPSGCNCSSGSC